MYRWWAIFASSFLSISGTAKKRSQWSTAIRSFLTARPRTSSSLTKSFYVASTSPLRPKPNDRNPSFLLTLPNNKNLMAGTSRSMASIRLIFKSSSTFSVIATAISTRLKRMTVPVRKNAKLRKSTGKKPCKMFKSPKIYKNLKLAHSFRPLSICTNKNKSYDLKKAWLSKSSQSKKIK